jgi:hypothetical protein
MARDAMSVLSGNKREEGCDENTRLRSSETQLAIKMGRRSTCEAPAAAAAGGRRRNNRSFLKLIGRFYFFGSP